MAGGLELTGADARLLVEQAELRRFAPGDVIRPSGASPQALFFLHRGSARYEHGGGSGLVLSAPSLFGAMSFLEQAPSKVVAVEQCEIKVIDGARVVELIDSVPGFGTRFYRLLALQLAHRLRAATSFSSSFRI
jgi:CRP-like cAMP-binding protein